MSLVFIPDESNLKGMPDLVIELDKSIRRCAIIDKSGAIVADASRKNVEPLVTDEAQSKEALHAAIRHFITPSWATAFGEKFYTTHRYEKIIIANITLSKEHLLLVSFDHDTDNFDEVILKKIRPKMNKLFVKE